MSDETMVTERDAVLRERAAYRRGVRDAVSFPKNAQAWTASALEHRAAKLYPLPTVTRPRVVADPFGGGISWRVVDGKIEWSGNASLGAEATWRRYPESVPDSMSDNWVRVIYPTAKRLELMLDLLDNPTEQVSE